MAKTTTSRIDIELPQLLADLKLGDRTEVVVLDTESAVGSQRIFDFAYSVIDPFKKIKGDAKGTLVYEALKDDYLISVISKWKKVKDAANDDTYGFYNRLVEMGWYSQEFSTQDLERAALDVVRTKAETKYAKQKTILKDLEWRQSWWEPESGRRPYKWVAGDASIQSLSEARERTEKARDVLNTLRVFVETGENLDQVMKQRLLGKNNTLASIKQNIYYTLYEQEKKDISKKEMRADLQLFQSMQLKQPVLPWHTIISSFDNDVSKRDILAVTAYNIAADKGFIKKTSNAYGAPGYANVLDKYQQICLQNMYKRLTEIPAKDIYNMLKKNDRQAIGKGYEEALSSSSRSGAAVSFDIAYRTEMNIQEFEARHTAADDVNDEAEFLEKVVQKYLAEHLGRR